MAVSDSARLRQLNTQIKDDRYSMKDNNECIGDIGLVGSHLGSDLRILPDEE
jgi:hypothetical protein